MKFSTFIILTTILFTGLNLQADCLACWEMQAVEFETTEQEKRTGYIVWSPLWESYAETIYPDLDLNGLSDFCDTITELKRYNSDTLVVYYDIVQIPSRFRKFPISLSTLDTLDLDKLLNFKMIKGKFNGAEGAGALPRITKDQYQLLTTTEPIASLKEAGFGLSDAYWFSYDPSIREKDLKEIASKRTMEDLYLDKIILIELAYD